MIYDIRLTDALLQSNGFPRSGPLPGTAKIFTTNRATPNNESRRYCRRCGKEFSLDHFDENAIDQCNYHLKTPGFRRGKRDNTEWVLFAELYLTENLYYLSEIFFRR